MICMFPKSFLALACLLLLEPASAEIYKSVGPDGKVIYTNVTPEKKAAAAIVQPAATRAQSRPADADAGGRILTPEVISAVSNVMGVAQLVSSSREFCVAAQPASHRRYMSAADGWGQRNSAVVAQKDRVLAHPVQHMVAEALNAETLRKTDSLMQPVKQSSNADRIQWCDKAFADVDRGVLDLVGRPSIAPLMNFGRR